MYQQAHPQRVYVYEGEEENEDGELYYAPAPRQDPYAVVRRPAQPNSMFFRVPNTNTDVILTVKEVDLRLVRYTLARPRPLLSAWASSPSLLAGLAQLRRIFMRLVTVDILLLEITRSTGTG